MSHATFLLAQLDARGGAQPQLLIYVERMKNKRFYKKFSELPEGYIHYLHNYLIVHTYEYFNNPDNKAVDERDFDYFSEHPTDRDHLVKYGEIMLVDIEMPECDHAYVICQVTRGRHKLASGRVVHLKPLKSVLPIANIGNNDWRNGYWLLPILG